MAETMSPGALLLILDQRLRGTSNLTEYSQFTFYRITSASIQASMAEKEDRMQDEDELKKPHHPVLRVQISWTVRQPVFQRKPKTFSVMVKKKSNSILVLLPIRFLKKHQYKESDLKIEHSLSLDLMLSEKQWLLFMVMWWRVVAVIPPQNMVHLFPLFFTGGGHSTARMASSNTVFRPRWVSAEHSRYFTAPEDQEADMVGEKVSVMSFIVL